MDVSRRQQLQAYGLSPGHCVRVMQHSPVTIIQAGHTELAMESDLAQSIIVEVKL
jgi:Fe2+ transport system protein FeoA